MLRCAESAGEGEEAEGGRAGEAADGLAAALAARLPPLLPPQLVPGRRPAAGLLGGVAGRHGILRALFGPIIIFLNSVPHQSK